MLLINRHFVFIFFTKSIFLRKSLPVLLPLFDVAVFLMPVLWRNNWSPQKKTGQVFMYVCMLCTLKISKVFTFVDFNFFLFNELRSLFLSLLVIMFFSFFPSLLSSYFSLLPFLPLCFLLSPSFASFFIKCPQNGGNSSATKCGRKKGKDKTARQCVPSTPVKTDTSASGKKMIHFCLHLPF